MAVPNPMSENPWANPWLGGPRKIKREPITGIDALDGLLRGWFAVEGFKTAKDLQEAQLRQQLERSTVERTQQTGAEPIPPIVITQGKATGGLGIDKDLLILLGLGALVLIAVK